MVDSGLRSWSIVPVHRGPHGGQYEQLTERTEAGLARIGEEHVIQNSLMQT